LYGVNINWSKNLKHIEVKSNNSLMAFSALNAVLGGELKLVMCSELLKVIDYKCVNTSTEHFKKKKSLLSLRVGCPIDDNEILNAMEHYGWYAKNLI